MVKNRCRYCLLVILLATINALGPYFVSDGQGADLTLMPSLRRPVAMALLDGGRWLFVVNQRSGSILVVDTAENKVTAEHAIGRKLSDLVALHDGRHLVAADTATGQLILLRWSEAGLAEVSRLDVPAAPVALALSADGRRLAVASLWTHRVNLIELLAGSADASGAEWNVAKNVELPFAPRKMCFLERDTKLVVADAFGGRLSVVDPERGKLLSVRELPGHNLRGLALSADGRWLLIAHQAVSPLARADREDIHWGTLLRNNLRWLSPEYVAGEHANLLAASRLEFLGGTGNGAADPAAVLALSDGRVAVALAGVDAVLLSRTGAVGYQRIEVGRRPTALAASAGARQIYVANTLADSISVLDADEGRVVTEISLGPQADLLPADRGELLFYDGRLSHDGWMSCQSCHPDGHTSHQLVDNFTDGAYGNPKRVLSLLGSGETGPWAWHGSMPDLERQVRFSITSTMQGGEPADEAVTDLAAFVRSLEPPPGTPPSDAAAAEGGRKLFEQFGCQHCHPAPRYTVPGVFDVGMSDESGHAEFNPPSLRGVAQRDRYFHDNRAETLADVFSKFRHPLSRELTRQEIDALVSFLRTL